MQMLEPSEEVRMIIHSELCSNRRHKGEADEDFYTTPLNKRL